MAETREHRLETILDRLYETYPDATISLNYQNRLELLVAVILSAQCTDVRVNQVTAKLFTEYDSVEAFASADIDDVSEAIGSITYPNSKAGYLVNASKQIRDEYDGQVPDSMEALTNLPGVGRKTANVVLQHGHDIREGVVVDTHVMRLSQRLDLVDGTTPKAMEQELMDLLDRSDWQEFTHLLISHGRATCTAINPDCESCVLEDSCPSSQLQKEIDLASGNTWN